ncbi:hypothetical protein GCK32_021480, partial [Trichostrongylus colubriformis]
GFLSPHVLSSETLGLIILSPNILSPRIASSEKLLVEILSPHILGGPHTHEEASHEVSEIGSHSAVKESGEVEHKEHEAIHHGHGSHELSHSPHRAESEGSAPPPSPFDSRAVPVRNWPGSIIFK